MKTVFGLLSLLSLTANADLINLRVEDHFCGEVDPFIIGDACLINASSTTRKYQLLIDFDEFYYSPLAKIEVNDIFVIDSKYLEKIDDQDVINEMNDYFDVYYGKYHYKELLFPTDSVKEVTSSQVLRSYNLLCLNNTFAGDYMFGKVSITGTLNLLNTKNYTLKGLTVDYKLSMEENFSYIWAEGNAFDANTIFSNLRTYRPRIYTNHIKFDDLYSHKIFGEVDLILPAKEIEQGTNIFTGYTIMTAMEDHWGATVSLTCTLSN